MTYGTYGPRIPVHRDRFGPRKTHGSNLWAILHTSEGGESENAAENLGSYMTKPGDRPGGYGASYHVVFDTDRILPAVPYDVVAYSAAGANAQGVHGCFPGRANQSREQWLDPVSRAMIRQCAAWLCDVQAEFGIPVQHRMWANQMLAGDKGLGDHYTVTQAFGKTDHTDVGRDFPWDVLFSDIDALLAPPDPPIVLEDYDMLFIAEPTFPGHTDDTPWIVYYANPGNGPRGARAVGAHIEAAKKLGVPIVPSASEDHHRYECALYGIQMA